MAKIPRKGKKPSSPIAGRQTRSQADRVEDDELQHEGQAELSGSNSSSSRSASEDDIHSPKDEGQNLTTQVGGDDIDSQRPAKRVRLSSDEDQDSSGQEQQASEPEQQGQEVEDREPSVDTFQSAEDLNDTRLSGTLEDDDINDAVSEAARETIETETADQTSPMIKNLKRKRPKGWHMKKEYRSLRQALLQGSPAQSERQDSVETQDTNVGYEPAAILRRLPGRRRAPHADAGIEADMRRQLELKIAYRALVKAFKPLLIELAERTEQELSQRPKRHKEHEAYEGIASELERRFQARLQNLENQLQEEEKRLERQHEAVCHMRERKCNQDIADWRDDRLARCQNQYMTVLREEQKAQDDEATDDEDGLIGRPYLRDSETGARVALDSKYDSRCRWHVENQNLWESLEEREALAQEQSRHAPESLDTCPTGFAVYDAQKRAEASASINLLTLLEAEEEIARGPATTDRLAKPVTATDTSGLETLAAAIDMTSVPSHESSKRWAPAPPLEYPPTQYYTSAYGAPSPRHSYHPIQSYNDFGMAPARPEQQAPPFVKREDTSNSQPPELTRTTLSKAEGPTFEIVGGLPRSSIDRHGAGQQKPVKPAHGNSHRHSDDHKTRRKAITFDIIMHQPDEASSVIDPPAATQTSEAARLLDTASPAHDHDVAALKRPGPKAVYAADDKTDAFRKEGPENQRPPHWRPFENAIGPPLAQRPSYVEESGYPPHPMGTLDEPSGQAQGHEQGYTRPQESSRSRSNYHIGAQDHLEGAQRTSYAESHAPTPSQTVQALAASHNAHGPPHLAPKPRATSYPETLHTLQPSMRPQTPLERRYAPSPGHAHSLSDSHRYMYPPEPRSERHDDHTRYAYSPLAANHSTADQRQNFTYRAEAGRGPREGRPDLASDREQYYGHHYPHSHPYCSQEQPPSGPSQPLGPPPRSDTPLQRHPGQRIGQQLLPSTLDPNRYSTSAMTPSGPHHRKQRSSSGSIRSWNVSTTPQQGPPASSHHRSSSQAYAEPYYHSPAAPPPPHNWQQQHQDPPEARHWPGYDARYAAQPPSAHPQYQAPVPNALVDPRAEAQRTEQRPENATHGSDVGRPAAGADSAQRKSRRRTSGQKTSARKRRS